MLPFMTRKGWDERGEMGEDGGGVEKGEAQSPEVGRGLMRMSPQRNKEMRMTDLVYVVGFHQSIEGARRSARSV
jgi:hypothetical protein